jgi:hypothetical protein
MRDRVAGVRNMVVPYYHGRTRNSDPDPGPRLRVTIRKSWQFTILAQRVETASIRVAVTVT